MQIAARYFSIGQGLNIASFGKKPQNWQLYAGHDGTEVT